ncbi:MAG TPA: hypothetical protein VG028_11975 [Terriglobia bacterium]|nr:hypothetical protein [Terriglobia bacterium]
MRRINYFAFTLGLFFPTLLVAQKRAADKLDVIFPLAKGTYWVYRGPVESGSSAGTIRKTITWKMEITDVIKRQDISAAVVRGFPGDLWWYTEDAKPRDSLIVQVFPSRFYLLGPNEIQKALGALRDNKNNLQGLVRESNLFLDFPLVRGKRFGETELITRTDEFYSWVVGDERQSKMEGIRGVSSARNRTVYTISEFTVGSHTEFDFVSGVGIVRYMGHHNGTVSDFEMKLVEFHAGNE